MKKVGVMQPYLFPYVGYFQTLNTVDEYVIYDDVQFIKGGWINRNYILIGGHRALFTIRLADASSNKLINEVVIQDDFTKFLKTVAMCYSRAPQKEQVMALLERICRYEDRNLARFTGNSMQEIVTYLKIDTKLRYSSDLKQDGGLKAQDKVIAICQELDAGIYINAIGGMELYDKEQFRDSGIELRFLKTRPILYKQLGKEFVPFLSIIDVMMFNTVPEVRQLLNAYDLE